MTSFDKLIHSIQKDGNDGKAFEKFIKIFLKTDAYWKTQVRDVWMWEEYPDKWSKDIGTDLVFRDKYGYNWAVQVKCYDEKYYISKEDLDSFLSHSSNKRIQKKLIIASTNNLGPNARNVIEEHDKPVTLFLRDSFLNSQYPFPVHYKNIKRNSNKKPNTPHPYQAEAITNVVNGFKSNNRGQLIMACGTGKTLTSLWIKEGLKSNLTLYLVPSLNLLSQVAREWSYNSNIKIDVLCICSDKSVGKRSYDEIEEKLIDAPFNVQNDEKDIIHFIKSRGNKVIFCTYHSLPILKRIHKNTSIPGFELIIADEAHKVASERIEKNYYSIVLDNKYVRYKKILFCTATPRTYKDHIKKRAKARGQELSGMEDKKLFGIPFHTLSFSEAIYHKPKPLLTPYQVVVMGVDSDEISKKIIERELVKDSSGKVNTDAESLANLIGTLKAIKKYDISKIITFHTKVDYAQKFSEEILSLNENFKSKDFPKAKLFTDYVKGKGMSSFERSKKIKKLEINKKNEIRLISNARCLGEGIDVPTLDGIAFINPKYSLIDIVQQVGRAIRKSKNKTIGTIILPVFIKDGDNAMEIIENSNFEKIWWVLNALKSHDSHLVEELNELRTKLGKRKINPPGGDSLTPELTIDLPEKYDEEFINALKTLIIERTSSSWYYWYGKLVDYFNEYGDSEVPARWKNDKKLAAWCGTQRVKDTKHTKNQKELLDKVNFRFETRKVKNKYTWDEQFERVKNFYSKGITFIPRNDSPSYKDTFESLSSWIKSQRRLNKKGLLSKQKIKMLNSINFIWDPIFENDTYFANELINFVKKNKRFPSRDTGGKRISSEAKIEGWLTSLRQRKRKINNDIDEKIIFLVEKINNFSWDPKEDEWMNNYEIAKKYWLKNNKKWIFPETPRGGKQHPVQAWCTRIRLTTKQYPKSLTEKKGELLNDINFIWDTREVKFNEILSLLIQFKKKYGNFKIRGTEEHNSFSKKLVNWSNNLGKLKFNYRELESLSKIGFDIKKLKKIESA